VHPASHELSARLPSLRHPSRESGLGASQSHGPGFCLERLASYSVHCLADEQKGEDAMNTKPKIIVALVAGVGLGAAAVQGSMPKPSQKPTPSPSSKRLMLRPLLI